MGQKGNLSVCAAFEAFPYLSDIAHLERTESVVIREADEYMYGLQTVSSILFIGGQDIFLLSKEGERIYQLNRAWFFNPFGKNETVKDALAYLKKIGKEQQVYQVVMHYRIIGHLVIYKAPKTFTLCSWLEELLKKARSSLERQIEAINEKGNNTKMLTS